MQLGWQESLDNFKLFWGHILKGFFKVVVSSNYYCGYTFRKINLWFFFELFWQKKYFWQNIPFFKKDVAFWKNFTPKNIGT